MFQQKYEDIVVLIRTNRTDKTGLVMFRTIRTVRTVFKCWVRGNPHISEHQDPEALNGIQSRGTSPFGVWYGLV